MLRRLGRGAIGLRFRRVSEPAAVISKKLSTAIVSKDWAGRPIVFRKRRFSGGLTEKGLSLAVFFIYTGKELPEHATVTEKIGVILQKLIKEIA